MKISRLFTLIIIIDFAAMGIFVFLFDRPVSYMEYQGDGFSCQIPENATPLVFGEYDWHKHSFSEKGELYISHYRFQGTFEEELEKLGQYLKGAVFQQEIKIFDNGRFFLYARGKSWRKYVYVFSCDKEIFWVENSIGSSTLLTYKEVADRVVTTMKISGKDPDSALAAAITDINKQIVRYTQSPAVLLGIIGFVLLATTLILPASLIYLGGMVPDLEGTTIIRKERWVYVVIRGPLKYKGTFGTLVLSMEGLTLYYFRRPLLSLSREAGEQVSVGMKGGKSFLVVEEGKQSFQIHVTDPLLWMNDISSRFGG